MNCKYDNENKFQVPPRVSPQMISQISLDAQLDAADSSFADFAHFPETVIEHEVSGNAFFLEQVKQLGSDRPGKTLLYLKKFVKG